jgi:hypothetical protein
MEDKVDVTRNTCAEEGKWIQILGCKTRICILRGKENININH